ncbi:MAG: hypothetical protein AAGA92_02900 [Planctomycetota bacterium]
MSGVERGESARGLGRQSDLEYADGLAAVRRRLLGAGLPLAAVTGVACIAGMAAVLTGVMGWARALEDAVPTGGLLWEQRPDLVGTSIGFGIVGLMLAAAGMWLLYRALGPARRPPLKTLLTLASLPLMLCGLGLGSTATSGSLGLVAAGPLLVGFTATTLPLQMFVLCYCLLGLSMRQLRQEPEEVAEGDLPRDAAEYFAEPDAEALEAGLTPVGDFGYRPEWDKHRRVWMAPNGAYFLDATLAKTAGTTISAIGVCSATSDGRYFETVDQSAMGSAGSLELDDPLFGGQFLPGEPVGALIDAHLALVAEWCRERGCVPLEFAADDFEALARYGLAALMGRDKNELLWLANPYAGRGMPALPGRAIESSETLAAGQASSATLL